MKYIFSNSFQYAPSETGGMLYYSLNHNAPRVSFAEAAVKGQAPDKGLYFPRFIPELPKGFIDNIQAYSKEEIGFVVMKPYIGETITNTALQDIITETVNFNIPLVPINNHISSLELFHGPTLAFKDVGARFMSRCLGYFNKNNDKEVTVLVATSGDTGGAVANGFLGVEGIKVVILYPSGKVSRVQELQLTTLGKNITALEVEGTFDDCQNMVKQAFADIELNKRLLLTSANSINVARWLPQQLYYFYAYQQWQEKEPPVISVPSGNFGNICAGILANVSGLPVKHFIAACNSNKVVTQYLQSGNYEPQPAIPTISNAMDVGNPSNFIRIIEIFHQQFHELKSKVSSISVDDITTAQVIKKVFSTNNYLLDPHGAVAYYALENYCNTTNAKGFIVETAHPVKFAETVEKIIEEKVEIPTAINQLLSAEKQSIVIPPEFNALKEWLINQ